MPARKRDSKYTIFWRLARCNPKVFRMSGVREEQSSRRYASAHGVDPRTKASKTAPISPIRERLALEIPEDFEVALAGFAKMQRI